MKYWCKFDGEEREFAFARRGDKLVCTSGDKSYQLDLSLIGDGAMFSMLVDGKSYDVLADVQREQVALQIVGERFVVHVEDDRERAAHAAAGHKASGKRELRAAMESPALQEQFAATGARIIGRSRTEMAEFVAAESERYARLVRKLGLRPEQA
jgi:hypothetical protein